MEILPLYVWYGVTEEKDAGISAYHTHTAHELLYILEGAVQMHIAGKTYLLTPGHLVIIHAVEVHDLVPLTRPYRRYGIHITPQNLQELLGSSLLSTAITRHGEDFCHVFDLTSCRTEAEALLSSLYKEATQPRPMTGEWMRHRFAELMILLYRQRPGAFSETNPDPLIAATCRYMDANFRRELTVEELAKMHFFSVPYFIRRFRKAVGYTPKRYLILRRLAESRVLLCTTSDTVAAVAVQCGFADANAFVRTFRKETGITPGEYRRHYAGQNRGGA